jgi:hypothetical protein
LESGVKVFASRHISQTFELVDPGGLSETEFEAYVVEALASLYPHYRCFVFPGSFEFEGDVRVPDLALMAHDFSHWYVIEVELKHHSFEGHVLPQVTSFRYGRPQQSCISALVSGLGVERAQAMRIIQDIPRSVVVIANAPDEAWRHGLAAHSVQYLVYEPYRTASGERGVVASGELSASREHVAYGVYHATDALIRVPTKCRIAEGPLQLLGPEGALAEWHVFRDGATTWLEKKQGRLDLNDQTRLQIILSDGRRIALRVSD